MILEQNLTYLSMFTHVPISCLAEGREVFRTSALALLPRLTAAIMSQIVPSEKSARCIFTDESIALGIIEVKTHKVTVLFGPLSTLPCDNHRAQLILRRYGLSSNQTGDLIGYFGDTPRYSLFKFAHLVIYANHLLNNEEISIIDLLPDEYYESSVSPPTPANNLAQIDTDFFHDSQAAEQRLFATVKYGNLDELNRILSKSNLTGNTGILATDLLRNYKNLIICSITLASRAAVQGGLDYETAMRQSDVFFQKVELAPDMKHLLTLNHSMLRTFTKMVADRKIGNPDSLTATRIYNYVDQHIDQKIHIQQIADAMKLTRSYVCTQFKKETGMTLHDFVNRAKVDRAKMLLTTTANTCASIATALDFSTQSHFQEVFKRITGMTPTEYREQNFI